MERATELLAAVGRAEWDRVEDSAFDLLHSGRFRDATARAPTIVLVAEARLFGRLDVRGALALLSPLLVAFDLSALGGPWSARATLVATTALGAPGAAALDPDRRLRALLGTRAARIDRADADLRVRTGLAMAGAGVKIPPCSPTTSRTWLAQASTARGCSPVTRCLLAEVRAIYAGHAGDRQGERDALTSGLELAASLPFHASAARLHAIGAEAAARDGADGATLIDARAKAWEALVRGGLDAPFPPGRPGQA